MRTPVIDYAQANPLSPEDASSTPSLLTSDVDGNDKVIYGLRAVSTRSMIALEAFAPFGAENGGVDVSGYMSDAIDLAAATGSNISVGVGTWKLLSPVTSTKPITIIGAGRDLTIFYVPSSFPLGGLGVFQLTSTGTTLPELTRQQYAIKDLTIAFEQPDTGTLASMIHYPYALYFDSVGSVEIERVTIDLPWKGVSLTNSAGGAFTSLWISPLSIGVYIDTTYNNLSVYDYKSWGFGGTTLQDTALFLSPSIQAMVIRHADFMTVTSSLFYAGSVVRNTGWEGTVSFDGCTFDQNYGITHVAGRTSFTDCKGLNSAGADASLSSIMFTVTGGQVSLFGCNLAAGNSQYPYIDINWTQTSGIGGNFFKIIGGDLSFGDPSQDVNFIRVTGTNGLVNFVSVRAAHLFRSNKTGGGNYGEAFIKMANGTATNVLHFTDNVVSPMGAGNSPLLELTNDGQHVIRLNDLPSSWNNIFPATFAQARVDAYIGGTVASDTTIAPSARMFPVSGVAAIDTMSVPTGFRTGEQITIIPTGVFTWTTGGNFRKAGTAVVGQSLVCTWDGTKWVTSY